MIKHKINWDKLSKEVSKIEYAVFDENLESKRLKILLNEEDKELIKLRQVNTLDYPLERQNPNILQMLLNLNQRMEIIENTIIKKIEAIEYDISSLKSIFICSREKEHSIDGNGTLEDLEKLDGLQIITYDEEINKPEVIQEPETNSEIAKETEKKEEI